MAKNEYRIVVHKYAPELTKLHFGNKVLNTGNYWMFRNDDPNKYPTFREVVDHHYGLGELTQNDLDKAKIDGIFIVPKTLISEHNKAFWERKDTFIDPVSLQRLKVLDNLIKNWDPFHQNLH